MKKGTPWASPSFDACTSLIFLGVIRGGIPNLDILSILHLITSFFLYTCKFSFIQNFTQSSLATLVHSKDNRPLGFSVKTAKLSLKTQATVGIPSTSSISQKEPKNE